MAAKPTPPVVTVVEVDTDLEAQTPVSVTDTKDKKKDDGVVVTVTPLGPAFDSLAVSPTDTPAITPAASTHNLTVLPVYNEKREEELEETFPEGGLRAWLVVAGGWFGMFGSMGILNSMSIFNAYISSHQLADYPASTIGWIWSLFMFLSLFPGVYVGPIFDAYGPTWLLWPGSFMLVLGVFLSSFATQYWHFILTFSVITGLGASTIFGPAMAASGHWFKERRGLAFGIIGTGAVSGGIVLPFFLQGLLEKVGYGWTMRAMALLELFCLALTCLFVRTRLPPVKGASMHPNLRIFKELPFLLTTLADFFMELAIYTPITYLSSYALAVGYSQSLAFAIVSILNGASVFGRVSPGIFGPMIGFFNYICVVCALCAVAVVGILFPIGHMTAGLITFAILYGFCSGSAMTLTPLCVGQLCDTRKLGSYYAGMYVIVGWGYLFGTPMAGAIIGATGYGGIFVFTAVVLAISISLYMTVRVMKTGWLGKF